MATSAVAECAQLTIEINCETCLRLRLRWLGWRLFSGSWREIEIGFRQNAFSSPRLVIATKTSHREFQVSTSMRNCLHLECARHIRPHDPRESVSNLSRRKAIRSADDAWWCSEGEKWKLMNLWWAIESWWCMKAEKKVSDFERRELCLGKLRLEKWFEASSGAAEEEGKSSKQMNSHDSIVYARLVICFQFQDILISSNWQLNNCCSHGSNFDAVDLCLHRAIKLEYRLSSGPLSSPRNGTNKFELSWRRWLTSVGENCCDPD